MDVTECVVLCVGDVMLDRYVYSDMERISPEAPVPVMRMRSTRELLGGAGNVANNIAQLGGTAILVGLLGQDAAGQSVRRMIASHKRITAELIATGDRGTTCKSRFVAANQQVARFDEESQLAATEAEQRAILAASLAGIRQAQAVVISDYGKGVLTRTIVAEIVRAAAAAACPSFVDPKSMDFADYHGATCITPNLKELAAASGMAVSNEALIVRAARKLLAASHAQAILVTRSEKGMILVEATGEVSSVPARAREVFDVSGAGDTVIASMALLHAAGRPLSQAMHFANAAASVVVSKLGTATADMSEVTREIKAQDLSLSNDEPAALQPIERVLQTTLRWKQQGLVVGFTNGCFDVLHSGHVAMLAYARRQCDRLIVGLNSDASIQRLKGTTRPINMLAERATVLAGLRYVDCIVAFDDDTPIDIIRGVLPDVLVKGADYSVDNVVGADVVRSAGGQVFLAELIAGKSSTRTISRMQDASASS